MVARNLLPVVCVIALLLLPASQGAAAEVAAGADPCVLRSDLTMGTRPIMLKGLSGVRVIVSEMLRWNLDPARDSLLAGIEQVLVGGGVRVLSEAECARTPGNPTLRVRMAYVEKEPKVILELEERACLIRSPQVCIPVTNFRLEGSYRVRPASSRARTLPEDPDSARVLMQGEESRCMRAEAEMLESIGRELAQRFVAAYRNENPN